jgi:hypothetical protein
VYVNGAWAQFSTGAAITVVNNLTLTPQAADPGTPATGMLFYSDGTSRATGLWVYNGTGWVQLTGVRYQEFTHKPRFTVRAASTANVTLANQVENGDSFGGVTLATGNLVLLKNQTTASENGVYEVQVSGAPVRSTSYDDATELTYAQVFVTSGTNANTRWFQTSVLTSLSDSQTWSATAPTFSFTVPQDVYELDLEVIAGGGAGNTGGSGSDSSNIGGSGGGGGAGSAPLFLTRKVVPGEVYTVDIGRGGITGSLNGTATIISLSGSPVVQLSGAEAGSVGLTGATDAAGGAGGNAYTTSSFSAYIPVVNGGNGGARSGSGPLPGVASQVSWYAPTAASGGTGSGAGALGSGGGGGGPGKTGAGGAGGNGATVNGNAGGAGTSAAAGNYGAGGGGGGGGSESGSRAGGAGGFGMDGYVRISWS